MEPPHCIACEKGWHERERNPKIEIFSHKWCKDMDAYDLGLKRYPPDDDEIWDTPAPDWPEKIRPSWEKIYPDCRYVTDIGSYGHGPYEDMGGGPHDHLRCFNMRRWWHGYYPYCVNCGMHSGPTWI